MDDIHFEVREHDQADNILNVLLWINAYIIDSNPESVKLLYETSN